MDNPLLLPSIIIASSYVILGILFLQYMKRNSSPYQRFSMLKDIVSTVSSSVELHFPDDHPQKKKQKIERLTRATIEEMEHETNRAFTIDVLIDASMLANDTNPHLRAIRLSEKDTEELKIQSMRSLGIRQ